MSKRLAKENMCHITDGPVTAFVLMWRATYLAKSGKYEPDDIANALYEALDDYGYLSEEAKEL